MITGYYFWWSDDDSKEFFKSRQTQMEFSIIPNHQDAIGVDYCEIEKPQQVNNRFVNMFKFPIEFSLI